MLKRPKFVRPEVWAEAQFNAENSMPTMGNTTVKVAPLLLVVPLFSVARGVGGIAVDVTWEKKGRGGVRYAGPVLTQYHETVFLSIVHLLSGQNVGDRLEFHPYELLDYMGKSRNGGNYERLRQAIEDLFAARLDVWDEGGTRRNALSLRFLGDKSTRDGAKWHLSMAKTALELFSGHLTVLNMRKRAGLADGLQTFLYGYVAANNGKVPFTFEELRDASGSNAKDLGDFAKKVRLALNELVRVGLIKGYISDAKTVQPR